MKLLTTLHTIGLAALLLPFCAPHPGYSKPPQQNKHPAQTGTTLRYRYIDLGTGQYPSLTDTGDVLITRRMGESSLLYRNGKFTKLPDGFRALDLNANGEIVGEVKVAGQTFSHAALWHDSKITDLTPDAMFQTLATSINNSRVIVIRRLNNDETIKGTYGAYPYIDEVWSASENTSQKSWNLQKLASPEGKQEEISEIGDSGEVFTSMTFRATASDAHTFYGITGAYNPHDGRWSEIRGVAEVQNLTAHRFTEVRGINASGMVCGYDANRTYPYPFVWQAAKGKQKLPLPKDPVPNLGRNMRQATMLPRVEGRALGINDSGNIVGSVTRLGGHMIGRWNIGKGAYCSLRELECAEIGLNDAVLWVKNKPYDLNDLIVNKADMKGLKLSLACQINNRNQIVGVAYKESGNHMFLLIPVTR